MSETSSLPYEVMKDTKENKEEEKSNKTYVSSKKRVEAIIPAEKTDSVLSALEAVNIQATFYESKGMGKGEKYMIAYGKGGKTTKMSYSTRHTVVTIVDENKVEEVVNTIRESAKTGKANAGIIIISSVENIITI